MTTTPASSVDRQVQVGTIVRAPRRGGKGVVGGNSSKLQQRGRAVVALINENNDEADILWQDLAPRPLLLSSSSGGTTTTTRTFIVTPMIPISKEEREDVVTISELSRLLDFEQQEENNKNEETGVSVRTWKERGDALLRLGDASAAIPYYEAALTTSSNLQVGCTGLVKGPSGAQSEFQVAEVDCLEENDNADVPIMGSSNEEQTIPQSDIKLCFLTGEEMLQVRILLNLTRCLMQVADLEVSSCTSQYSPYYRRSAATACSMALAMLDILDDDEELSSLHATALLLRSRAYAGRSKWKPAMADAQSLTRDHSDYREGRKWMTQLESKIAQTQKTNQKLAKSMCEWVQNATSSEGGGQGTIEEESASPRPVSESIAIDKSRRRSRPHEPNRSSPALTLLWYLLLPLLLAILLRRFVSRNLSEDNSPLD